MLNKRRLQVAGSTLLLQARAATLEQRQLGMLPVPFMYRFGELYYFEKWRHPLLLVEARQAAAKAPSLTWIWALSAFLAWAASFFLSMAPLNLPWFAVWIVSLVSLLPAYLHRRELMRRHICQKT